MAVTTRPEPSAIFGQGRSSITSAQPLVFLPIAGFEDWLAGAVSCPDSNWGQLAVLRVNAIIDNIRQDKALRQNLQFWFGDNLPPYPPEKPR